MGGRAGAGRWLAAVVVMAACRGEAALSAVAVTGPRITFEQLGAATLLRLVVPDSQEVNARIPPALELADGSVIRFGGASVTADSSYYTEPAVARLAFRADTVHGILRAGICNRGERVCRTVKIRL